MEDVVYSKQIRQIASDEDPLTYSVDFTPLTYGQNLSSVVSVEQIEGTGMAWSGQAINSVAVDSDGHSIAAHKGVQLDIDPSGASAGLNVLRVTVARADGKRRSIDCRFWVKL